MRCFGKGSAKGGLEECGVLAVGCLDWSEAERKKCALRIRAMLDIARNISIVFNL